MKWREERDEVQKIPRMEASTTARQPSGGGTTVPLADGSYPAKAEKKKRGRVTEYNTEREG
jgi:hypothetical protein